MKAPCNVRDCDRQSRQRGMCGMHYQRWWKHGDTSVVKKGHGYGQGSGADHPGWRGDDISYSGMHRRLRRLHGPARSCDECGRSDSDTSYQWALDKRKCLEENLRWWARKRDSRRVPFSVRVEDYIRLCLSCHWYMDRVSEPA